MLRLKSSIHLVQPSMTKGDIASNGWAIYRVWASASVAKTNLVSFMMFDSMPLNLLNIESYPIILYGKFTSVSATTAPDETIRVIVDRPYEQELGI